MDALPIIAEVDLLAIAEQLDTLFDMCAVVAQLVADPAIDQPFGVLLVEECGLFAGDVAQELRDIIDDAIAEATGPVLEAPAQLAEAA